MTKKILSVFVGMLMAAACFVGSAAADDATTVYVELEKTTVMPLYSLLNGGSVIRGRVTFLDASGALATTYGGYDISSAKLTVTSSGYTGTSTGIEWESKAAGTAYTATSVDPTLFSASTLSLTAAWQEIAISYKDVTKVGTDTLTFKLSKGSSSISATKNISISGPVATGYMIRTGGVAAVPTVLDNLDTTLPAQINKGTKAVAGDSVVVDVYAVYTSGTTDYFTDNVPSGAEIFALNAYNTSATVSLAASSGTLVDGHVQLTVPITDLKIKEYLLYMNKQKTNVANADLTEFKTLHSQQKALTWMMNKAANPPQGVTVTFMAQGTGVITPVGSASGAIETSDKDVVLSSMGVFLTSSAAMGNECQDTARLFPANLNKVVLVPIPSRQVTEHGNGGYWSINGFAGTLAAARAKIGPVDAFYLPASSTNQVTSFKSEGDYSTDAIFAGLVGYDSYSNPAPFSTGSADFKFGFPSGNGAYTSTISTITATGYAPVFSTTVDATNKTTVFSAGANDCYLPLMITTTSMNEITDIYLVQSGTTVYGTVPAAIDDLDDTSGAISFYFGDKIGAITVTSDDFNDKSSGSSGNMKILRAGGNTQDSAFTLRALDLDQGTSVLLGADEATSGGSTFSLSSSTSATKVAVFGATKQTLLTDNILIFAEGATSKFQAVCPITLTNTTGRYPADPSDFAISAIGALLSEINLKVDDEENHDTSKITNSGAPEFLVLDAFGSSFNGRAEKCHLDDADLEVALYLPNVDGSASDVEFPGGKASISDSTIEMSFKVADITADQDEAVLKLSSKDGTVSGATTIKLTAPKSLIVDNKYVAVPGVTDTPIIVSLADQNGALFVPVTETGDVDLATWGIDVELEVDDKDNGTLAGTVTGSDKVYLSALFPQRIVTIRPATGKTLMDIGGQSDYGDATLSLNFEPDFDAPVVGALTGATCGFTIAITDNREVDIAATVLVIVDPDGLDVTDTVTRTNTDNSTSGSIAITGLTTAGAYSVTITAQDAAGNIADTLTKTVTVTDVTNCPVADCLTVDPAYVQFGDAATEIDITGSLTAFVEGTTTVEFGCASVTAGTVTVSSETALSVNISVPAEGIDEECDVTVTTGIEVVTCEAAFQVAAEPVVTAPEDNCTDGIDNDEDGLTDCDDTDDCAEDDACVVCVPADEICDDGVDNDCDEAVDCDDSDCAANAACVECEVSKVSPASVKAGRLFPRIRVVTITVEGGEIARGDKADFGDDIKVLMGVKLGKTRMLALISVPANTEAGSVDVTVGECVGEGVFTIK